MIKKGFKKVAAFALATTMLMPTVVFAAGEPNLEIENVVEKGIFCMDYPTSETTKLSIDAMELLSAEKSRSQVFSSDIVAINKSNYPIDMQVIVKAKLADGVEFDDKIKVEGLSDTTKKLYMVAMMPASNDATVAGPSDPSDPSTKVVTIDPQWKTYDGTSSTYASEETVDLTVKGVKLNYLLDAAKYTTDTPPVYDTVDKETGTNNAAVFKIAGTVNPRAAWAEGDVVLSIVYKPSGISAATYATKLAAATAVGTFVGDDEVEVPTITNSEISVTSVADDVPISFTNEGGSDATTITSVAFDFNGVANVLATTAYTVTSENRTISLKLKGTTNDATSWLQVIEKGAKGKFTVTFDDGTDIVVYVKNNAS